MICIFDCLKHTTFMNTINEVSIIGAGISGLIAAIELEKNGIQPVIYEASDRVGGRVKTDIVDGFRLDHGFQVLLTAYPEAKKYLDYPLLDLKSFDPGALIFDGNHKMVLSDPLRQPSKFLPMLFSEIGSLSDKFKMWSLSKKLKKKSIEEIFNDDEESTLEYLREFEFSEDIINNFFTPFFSGIFLENQLNTSSRMFEFVFKMFSEGNAAVPAKGMQEIPNQLANKLQNSQLYFNKVVSRIEGQTIIFTNGEMVEAEKIIVACDPYTILPGLAAQHQAYHTVINLYFATEKSVINQPLIGLVPRRKGLINNFNYMTDVSIDYAPADKHLLSISVVKKTELSDQDLVTEVKNELSVLTGQKQDEFSYIKMFRINQALPVLEDIRTHIEPTATRIQNKVFLAGDYLLNGSLNAAMISGRAAANAVLAL